MKILTFLACASLIGLTQAGASLDTETAAVPEPPARRDLVRWRCVQEGEIESRATGRPVLYFFTADWCPICEALERTVFSDPEAAALVEALFVPVEVNDRRDANGDSAQDVDALKFRFLVSRLPVLVVSDPDAGPAVSVDGAPVYSKMLHFLASAGARLAELTREWESKRLAPS